MRHRDWYDRYYDGDEEYFEGDDLEYVPEFEWDEDDEDTYDTGLE